MGKRGPTPAPTRLKLIRGDPEARINREEPMPTEGMVTRPRGMTRGAINVWEELAPDLYDKGCLTPWDVYALEMLCEAVGTYRDCRRLLKRQYIAAGASGGVIKSPYHQIMRDCVDVMTRLGSRFGLSPGDRANMTIEKDKGMSHGAERILG